MTKARIIADYAGTGATTDLATQAELDAVSTVASAALPKAGGTMTGDLVPATPLSHRNMIINGGMQVWQRATAATGAGNAYNTADRYQWINNTDGNFTSERYTMSLAELNTTGHGYAAKLICIGVDAGTTAAGHYGFMRQKIEAQNLQQLQYGTANAKTMTLSFWVKSSMTGAYNVALIKDDSTSYYIPIEYTISSADTWEKKIMTITPTAGSTSLITGAGGIINNDNGTGFHLDFILSCGSTYHGTTNTWSASVHLATSNQVNWLDSTSSRTFYITGVQLELGSSATPFEHRSYADELLRCQRYYQLIPSGTVGSAYFNQSSDCVFYKPLQTTMRGTVTHESTGADGSNYWRLYFEGGYDNMTGDWSLNSGRTDALYLYSASGISGTAGSGCVVVQVGTLHLAAVSEL